MPLHASSQSRVAPLLKWAGGKRQLLPVLAAHYPAGFNRYFEPFFGSGAVFFDLLSRGRLEGRQVFLSDVNPDLVGCYLTLRAKPEAVIRALAVLEREHAQRGDACYYEVRDQRFNLRRAAIRRDGADPVGAYTPQLAAMLIYLNRTGFNGLFRLNRSGGFNVPAGRYAQPRICDPTHLRAVAAAFNAPGVTIEHKPFTAALEQAGDGDFVYCDPPYEPLSRTSSFASYTADGFTMFDQRRLQQAVVAAARRGASVVLSNSSAPAIVDAYEAPEAKRAKLRLTLVPARRAINSRASARGVVDEVLVTNVPAAARPSLDSIRPQMARAQVARGVKRRMA